MDDVMITELHRECIHRESHWPIITDNEGKHGPTPNGISIRFLWGKREEHTDLIYPRRLH